MSGNLKFRVFTIPSKIFLNFLKKNRKQQFLHNSVYVTVHNDGFTYLETMVPYSKIIADALYALYFYAFDIRRINLVQNRSFLALVGLPWKSLIIPFWLRSCYTGLKTRISGENIFKTEPLSGRIDAHTSHKMTKYSCSQ